MGVWLPCGQGGRDSVVQSEKRLDGMLACRLVMLDMFNSMKDNEQG